jgi:hypothetical protein
VVPASGGRPARRATLEHSISISKTSRTDRQNRNCCVKSLTRHWQKRQFDAGLHKVA